jgi:NAD(P)-dependent dehydrogenase (short-subunit alcohol dehydrogenase family)
MAGNASGAVVVTGASTGIGRATALLQDKEGYTVFAGVRKQEDAKSLAEEGSDRLTPITIDVTKERSIADAKQSVEQAVGEEGLVGLVNNAGVGDGGPVETMDLDVLRNVLEVNLVGQVAVTQAFLPLIRKTPGTIVFIASIGGRIASPFMSPYNTSKFAIEALGESLRQELAPWGIDVAVIEPGSIDTPIWRKGAETIDERWSSSHPMQSASTASSSTAWKRSSRRPPAGASHRRRSRRRFTTQSSRTTRSIATWSAGTPRSPPASRGRSRIAPSRS